MKDLLRALETAEEFTDPSDDPLMDVCRLIKVAHRKTCELEMASMDALELLEHIRYQEWPRGMSDALDLTAERMDEVILRLERAVNNARRKTPKRKR